MASIGPALESLQQGNLELFKSQLAANPAIATARTAEGVSLLMQALYLQQSDAVDAILDLRSGLDLFEAASLGDLEVLGQALDTDAAEAKSWSADGFSALHLAAYFDHPEAVGLLLRVGAEVRARARNPTLVEPLHSAVAARSIGCAKPLLDAGANPNAPQQMGFTALMGAAGAGDEALIDLLLSHGAQIDQAADDGRVAADFAAAHGHQVLATRLRDLSDKA